MRGIIDFAYSLLDEVIGFKALFLHSLPEAEGFYGAGDVRAGKLRQVITAAADGAAAATAAARYILEHYQ